MEKKKRSPIMKLFRFMGVLLLILLLLIAAFLAFLYFMLGKENTVIDDCKAMAQEISLSPEDRFSFDAKQRTMSIGVDVSDCYWYYEQMTGESLDETMRRAFPEGIQLEGVGISLDQKEPSLDVSAKAGPVKLHCRFPVTLSWRNEELLLCVDNVKIGGISIKLDEFEDVFGFDEDDLEIRIPVDHYLLREIDDVRLADGKIVFTGPMNLDLVGLSKHGYSSEKLNYLGLLYGDDGFFPAIMESALKDTALGEQVLLEILEKNPGLWPDVMKSLYTNGDIRFTSEFYPLPANHEFFLRLMPEFNMDDYMSSYDRIDTLYLTRKTAWLNFIDNLYDANRKGKIILDEDGFVMDGAPLRLSSFLNEEADYDLSEATAFKNMYLAFADYAGADDDNIPKLGKIVSSLEMIPDGLDAEKRYPLAVISKGEDGKGYICFITFPHEVGKTDPIRMVRMLPIQSEQLEAAARGENVWRYQYG